MRPTQILHDQGQSIWLDNITRDMLNNGSLRRYRDELSVTGLTSNPSIFEAAIANGHAYDEQIRALSKQGLTSERLFAELAAADLQRAADLFRPIFDRSDGLDGWVSMEVSPLLVNDSTATVLAAKLIHTAIARPNVFVKIPGSQQGVAAIEETLFSGIPVNVTLLFSAEQYRAVADAYMRALERRIAAGLKPNVTSVASVFVSRWDVAIAKTVPENLHNKLGIAIAHHCYEAYWELLNSQRWRALESQGARPQRLLWASTGTKDPNAKPTLYIEALSAPNTINTMPEKTLLAFADHGVPGVGLPNAVVPEAVLAGVRKAGIDLGALATQLQEEGAQAFARSWSALMERLGSLIQVAR